MLSGKCVVLGVTGGIAAYKACEIVSRLKKLHANVRVVMTEHACRFVAPLSFETLSGNQVYVSQFDHNWEIEHISLAKSADLMLVNLVHRNDIVVTQDYGLAALCLARGARPLDQNGRIYDESNIDSLLGMRHISQKIRRAGGRTKGPSKRTKEQDEWFEQSLEKLLSEGSPE